MTPKERFLAAVTNRDTDRPPAWMMRQAGRYLPEYRVIKKKHSTKEMMQTPEIAKEITLQPVRLVGTEAAILYSDILMIPDAFGMGLDFVEGEGPHFAFPIDSESALNKLNTKDFLKRLSFVFETIRLCKKELPKDYPLLGFAGAPWTVACYMMSGGKFETTSGDVLQPFPKTFAKENPKVFEELMTLLTEATISYLQEQADAGVIAIQLFDTWAGLLTQEEYKKFAKPYSEKIFQALTEIPTIHYIKNSSPFLEEMIAMSSNAISIDSQTEIATVDEKTKGQKAIQGNLDPQILLTDPKTIEADLRSMLIKKKQIRKGYIINLGHGVLPQTPVENVKCFFEKAKMLSLQI